MLREREREVLYPPDGKTKQQTCGSLWWPECTCHTLNHLHILITREAHYSQNGYRYLGQLSRTLLCHWVMLLTLVNLYISWFYSVHYKTFFPCGSPLVLLLSSLYCLFLLIRVECAVFSSELLTLRNISSHHVSLQGLLLPCFCFMVQGFSNFISSNSQQETCIQTHIHTPKL